MTVREAEPTAAPDLVARAAVDPARPGYHFTSPAGWLNDPNGVCTRNGRHHLFYQYNPEGAFHHRIQWGHAVSDDFLHWVDLPIALEPADSGPDVDGCWSGVLVDVDSRAALVYSGRHGERELPCVAWADDDDLVSWTRSSENPVVSERPAQDLTAYRDHCVWKEGDGWKMIVGSGIRGVGGCAFLYGSTDLEHWDELGPLVVGDSSAGKDSLTWTGTMWECVDLFHLGEGALGDKTGTDVLVFSAWDEGRTLYPLYFTGRYDGSHYVPAALHRLDLGGRHFYAPQSYRTPDGRRILWGWMQEARTDEQMMAAGWCGVMGIPRELTLGDDGSIWQRPVHELDETRLDLTDLGDGARLRLGNQLDMEVEAHLDEGQVLRLVVAASEDGREQTVLLVRATSATSATIELDRSSSTLTPDIDVNTLAGELPLLDGRLSLRVLTDHSCVEIFANGRSLSARVNPSLDGQHVQLDGDASILRADCWEIPTTEQAGRILRP